MNKKKEKKIGVVQSNYIPWKGYFDLISYVDEFVIYDDCQFTKRDWRNRNKIKTPSGLEWLTIPVEVKGKYFQKIKDTKIANKNWGKIHWSKISHNYSKTKFFKIYKDVFKPLFLDNKHVFLNQINFSFIQIINKMLNIKTKIKWSMDYKLDAKSANQRILSICKQSDASTYVSGPLAKNYIDQNQFVKEGIKIEWFNYDNYQAYHQLFPPFEHKVSVLDLIFNEGPNAKKFLKSYKNFRSGD
tara:strand:+ start:1000 stop:1728 length:729 start_codon:yes stop_codon:yes gene_type:complete